MKNFKLQMTMFLAIGIAAVAFTGCAKDYDDDIRRIENSSKAQLGQLQKDIENMLDAVKQQIHVLEHTTMPEAIKKEADKVREELAAVKSALEERILAVEQDLASTKANHEQRIAALEQFKNATEAVLLDYGARLGALESRMTTAEGNINTLTQNLATLRGEYDAFKEFVALTYATKGELAEQYAELIAKIQEAYDNAVIEIGEAEARSKTYTDEQLDALKQEIEDSYGRLLPDVANLLDKLGVDADGNLTVIDDLTGRVTALEDLDLDGRLQTIEDAWPQLVADVTAIAGQVDSLGTVVSDIVTKLDAIGDHDNGLLGEIFTELTDHGTRITDLEGKVDSLQNDMADKVNSADLDAVKDSVAVQKAAVDQLRTDLNDHIDTLKPWIARIPSIESDLAQFKTDLEAADAALSGRMDSVANDLAALADRVTELEEKVEALLGRIQSLTFVPDNSSGKIILTKAGDTFQPFTATFLVSPADKAATIAQAIVDGGVTAKFIVNETATRAIVTNVQFEIDAATAAGNADGTISLEVTPSGLNPEMFYSVALQLIDANEPNGTQVVGRFITAQVNDAFADAAIVLGNNQFTPFNTTDEIKYNIPGDPNSITNAEKNYLKCLDATGLFSNLVNPNGIDIAADVSTINGQSTADFATANNLDASKITVTSAISREYMWSNSASMDEIVSTPTLSLNDDALTPVDWDHVYSNKGTKITVEYTVNYDGEPVDILYAYIYLENL